MLLEDKFQPEVTLEKGKLKEKHGLEFPASITQLCI